MFDWREVIVGQERRQEFLLEAEKHRLVRHALAGRETRDGIHRRALTWVGHRLVVLGCFLERHYGSRPMRPPCRRFASAVENEPQT